MTGGCSMAAMIVKGPPQWGQCSRSISNTERRLHHLLVPHQAPERSLGGAHAEANRRATSKAVEWSM
jgi:hypothetical protein